jgi:predicted lipid-binding transport protein (Tim44 family)
MGLTEENTVKPLFVALLALALGAGLLPGEAEAKGRLGGGRSLGSQRQVAPPQKATPPSQQQAAPQQNAGASRWLGPLAALAAGLGLGWLFANGGFGAVLGTLLLALAAGFIVMLLVRLLARGRPEQRPMQYAGLGNETVAAPPPSQIPLAEAGSGPNYRSQFVPDIPAGFDVKGFLEQAKRNFISLQEANDRGDLDALREVATAEMFEALKEDLVAHGREKQQTDVVTLQAALLEVATEGPVHWASVRFSGTLREDARSLPAPFEEIWHLQKPIDGSTGWLLAGIKQVS